MEDIIILGVDLDGEWVEGPNRYTWRSKGTNTVGIIVRSHVTYVELVDNIIANCELNCDPRNVSITYMLSLAEKQKTPPFGIQNDRDLRVYLADRSRPILRVCVVERSVEVLNSPAQDQDVQNEGSNDYGHELNDTGEDPLSTNIQGIEEEAVPRVAINTPGVESGHSFVDDTGFYKGKTFKDKNELIVSLKLSAVKKPFTFKPEKNTSCLFSVKCVDINCKWKLRAMKYKDSAKFYITKYINEHTCGVQHPISHHPHASASVIAEYLKNKFGKDKCPSTKEIKQSVLEDLGCSVSYWKCLQASHIAKALTRGTSKHGYAILDAYSYMIRTVNEGSKTALKLDDQGKFKYFFVSYGPWIRGFRFLRKVLVVDGTFLTGEYGGVLLSAVALDTENHIYPIAFCVVDVECDASYEFFFEQLLDIVPNSDELCIISDENESIEKWVSKIFPLAHYGCCMRHLGESIRAKFRCGDFLQHYYFAAQAYQTHEFNAHFDEIKANDVRVATYLENVGFHKWSRAHFPGNRYDVLTKNFTESVDKVFSEEREFPIVALFDAISRHYAEKFHLRHMEFVNSSNMCVPAIEKKIQTNMTLSDNLLVHKISYMRFSVTGHNAIATVDLHNRVCSCREFDLDKLPCRHAVAALKTEFGNSYGSKIYEYTSTYYSVESYFHAYAEPINPVPPEELWEVPAELLVREIPPPEVKRTRGRKKTKHMPSVGEVFMKRENKCSLCKNIGHKKTTCPTTRREGEGTSHS